MQIEKYYANNKLYREDGPAIIRYYENGNKFCEKYYANNNLYNKNGPTGIFYYKNGNKKHEEYYTNNELHNENGPAIIKYYEDSSIRNKEYYINGEFIITDKEAERYINSAKPIKIKNINKLKILLNICKARNLKDKVDEI